MMYFLAWTSLHKTIMSNNALDDWMFFYLYVYAYSDFWQIDALYM